MKSNRKKFIYLISPLKINKSFHSDLINIFKQKKVSFFQLRLKKESFKKKFIIGKKIKKICKKPFAFGVITQNSFKKLAP